MTYIKQATTPTLIQHGELDRRVPIPNASELRQGLEDRGVQVEMVGEATLDFARPALPKKPEDDKERE